MIKVYLTSPDKQIATFESAQETWTTGSYDTTNFKQGISGRLVAPTASTTVTSTRTVTLDLTLFPDNQTVKATDIMDLWVYVDNYTNFSSAYISAGTNTSNEYRWNITSQITATGWNHVQVNYSARTETGTVPVLTTITQITVSATANGSGTCNVTFDDWQLRKRNGGQYYEFDSLRIVDQIQNKANTASFNLTTGARRPTENQDVKIYDAFSIVSLSGTALVIENNPMSGVSIVDYGKLRVGDYIWLGIDLYSQEKVKISALAESGTNLNITLSANARYAHSANELAGKLIYAGIISSIADSNPRQLTDIEYSVDCTDFTKVFDKKNLATQWSSKTSRQIITSFVESTVNYNSVVDQMEYTSNAAIQAVWIEANDGNNPTTDSSSYMNGTGAYSGVFGWTFAAGTAVWAAAPTAVNYSAWAGVSSGFPLKGRLTFWYKMADYTKVTAIKIRIGSDSSNYLELTVNDQLGTFALNNNFNYCAIDLLSGTMTGTPDWTAIDYVQIRVTETASSSINIDDMRIQESNSFTLYNMVEGQTFTDARANYKKPTVFINSMAKIDEYYWYIDYERNVHYFDQEENTAPFEVTNSSDNFDKLEYGVDTSQLKNRQTVRGGFATSTSSYVEDVEADGVATSWTLKSQFKNLVLQVTDLTLLDAMDVATGWSATGGNVALNTTDFYQGTGSLDLQKTTVASAEMYVSKNIASVDLTNRLVSLFVKVKDQTTYDLINNFEILLFSGANFGYIAIAKNTAMIGNWYRILVDINDFTDAGSWNKAAIDSTRFDVNTNNVADIFALGDVKLDYQHYLTFTTKTVGVENLDAEASFQFMSNYQQASVRNSTSNTTVVPVLNILRFTYNEVYRLVVQAQDSASITSMKALLGGDGIYDGAVIFDESLDEQVEAQDRALAEVAQYSNPIVEISFVTNYEGLQSGQILHISDTNREVDDYFIIQKVAISYSLDFPTFKVTCASSLFGIIEYFQKLSQSISDQAVDDTEVIDTILSDYSMITLTESNTLVPSISVSESATITLSEAAATITLHTGAYKWQPDASDARWNLASWS